MVTVAAYEFATLRAGAAVMVLSFNFHMIRNMKNTDAIGAFLALGQESRLNVFRLIVQRGGVGLSPSEMIENLGIPNATLSFHLKELVRAQLLLVERRGRYLIYRANAAIVQELSAFLLENCCGGKPCLPYSLNKKSSLP